MHGYKSYDIDRRQISWIGGYEKGITGYWKGIKGDFPIRFFDWEKDQSDNAYKNQCSLEKRRIKILNSSLMIIIALFSIVIFVKKNYKSSFIM